MSTPIPTVAVDIINNVVGSTNLITGEVQYGNYGYNINLPTAAFFTAAFGLVFLVHVFQAGLSRRWFLLYTLCLGAGLEAGGWGARLVSAKSTAWDSTYGGLWGSNNNAFMAQITMLILAPAFEMAGNYVLLGVLVNNLGQQYSKLAPRTYVWLFLSGDVISLCIQGGGGGVAASALTLADANTGGYIMAGGTIFQLVIMSCFTCLFVDFTIHYLKDRPNKQIHPFSWLSWRRRRRSGTQANSPTSTRTAVEELKLDAPTKKHAKLMLLGIAISTFFVFVRSVYRCPELLKGWNGPIIKDQILFDIMDAVMILISMISLNILHPIWLVPTNRNRRLVDTELQRLKAHRTSY